MLGDAVTVEAPKREPLMLADAKRFLRVDGTALDGDIQLAIHSAREDIETRTGLRLIEQVVSVSADTFADLAHLTVGPVQTVRSIRYLDTTGAEQLLDPTRYRLTGGPFSPSVTPAFRASLPAVGMRTAGITVELVVGFGLYDYSVPPKIRHAMLALVRGIFEEKPVDVEPQLVNLRINA